MRITVIEANNQREVLASELADTLKRVTTTPGATLWVDMCGPTEEDAQAMENIFKFHPLAIEDTRNHHQRPSINEYSDYFFAILNPLAFEHKRMFFRELDVFVGPQYFVTVRMQADRMAEELVDGIRAKLRTRETSSLPITPAYLMYLVANTVVDTYFPVMDKIGYELDELEEAILDKPQPKLLNRVFRLKRDLMELWRIAGQQRDMFSLMTNRDAFMSSKTLRYYFRDAYDHLLRINDVITTYRDVIAGLMDLYMSVVSNRLNVIVQRFTIVTVIIGIFTVISGFYGMNFDHSWPPSNATWSVPLVLAAMFVLAGAFLVFLKQRELL